MVRNVLQAIVSFALPQQAERKTVCNFDTTEFATRLSTLRKSQGMTQEEMAEVLNISLEHLSKMERGKRKPSIDLIIAMACYFHVSTDYLLMGKDHDMVDSRTKLLDVVTQLTEIAKSL